MKKNCFVLFLFVSILFVSSASALQHPFLYTTTIPESEEREFIVHLDAGWGSGSLGSPEATFIDRRLGLMAGRFKMDCIIEPWFW